MGRPEPTTVTVILTREGETLRIGRAASDRCDVAFADMLLRLTLTAKRLGWSVRLEGAGDDLRQLFAFLGLSELLAFGSALQSGRQAESGEQGCVEEVVQPGDAPP